ncbi:hypothetical protein D3C86_1235200 [compost metagenome]
MGHQQLARHGDVADVEGPPAIALGELEGVVDHVEGHVGDADQGRLDRDLVAGALGVEAGALGFLDALAFEIPPHAQLLDLDGHLGRLGLELGDRAG